MFSAKTSRDVGTEKAAWKNQLAENVQEQWGVCRDILTTQVKIRQLQGMLDTYFTIPTSVGCCSDRQPLVRNDTTANGISTIVPDEEGEKIIIYMTALHWYVM